MHKKSVFIFLLLSAFISLKTNAQNIGVYQAISETEYSDLNIYHGEPLTLNVLAGQSLHFCITLTEKTANYFTPSDGIVKIELSNGATFSNHKHIEFGEISGDISSIEKEDPDLNNETSVTRVFTIDDNSPDNNNIDEIIIKNIKIVIPSKIDEETDYTLTLTHNLSGGDDETTELLTFHYQKPQISITAPVNDDDKGCIDGTSNFTIKVTPEDLTYDLYVNGDYNSTITKTTTLDLGYSDEIYVQDGTNTQGKSEVVTFDNVDYYKGISIDGYNGEPLCPGEEVLLTINKNECDLVNFEFDLLLNGVPISDPLYSLVGNNITYKPIASGSVTLRATHNAIQELVLHSEAIEFNSILDLPEHYEFYPEIRIPKENGPIDLFNRFKTGGSFNQNDTTELTIAGIYHSIGSAYNYFVKNGTDDQYTFGRFKLSYASTSQDANSMFNPDADGVNDGEGADNVVWFHYGKHYGGGKYCYDSTSTNIKVITSEIFIGHSTYCSYQDTPEEFTISTEPQYLAFPVDNKHISSSSYYGYAILNQSGDTIQKGTSDKPSFTPSDLWTKRTSPASTSMYVEVVARAKVEISRKPDYCPEQWNPNNGGLQYIYPKDTYVNYLNREYKSNAQTLSTDVPGLSPKWEDLGECDYVLIKPDPLDPREPLKPLEIKGVVLKEPVKIIDVINPILHDPYKEYNCKYDTWNRFGNPQPIYNIGDSVTYEGYVYKCISPAYSYHIPNKTSTVWSFVKQCGDASTDVLIITNDYAKESFYIHEPKTNGTITNLYSTFCPSIDSILLESNYTIENVTGNGISKFVNNGADYFYYSYGKANKIKTEDNLVLSYTDNNGCSNTANLSIKIDPEYAVDKTGSLYWNNNNILKPLDDKFCSGIFPYQLATSNNFKVDTIYGPGIGYSEKDKTYSFNPSMVESDERIITLSYIDKNTSCPYTKTHKFEISSEYADTSAKLLLLDEVYCPADSSFNLQISNNHRIYDFDGEGIDGVNNKENGYYTSLTYNPFTAITGGGVYNYNAEDFTDNVKVHFLDDRNCPYTKESKVKISREYRVNKNAQILWDTGPSGDPQVLGSKFCLGSYDYKLTAAQDFTINSIGGEGVSRISESDPYIFNPASVAEGVTSTDLTLYYIDNVTHCPYSINHTVNLSADNADKSSGLKNFDTEYCVVNNNFNLQTINSSHEIVEITGKGISGNQTEGLKYNPFNVVATNGKYDYSNKGGEDNVIITFHDDRNCPYTKTYPVIINPEYSVNKNAQILWNIGGTDKAQVLDSKFCLGDYDYKLTAANDFDIKSIGGDGVSFENQNNTTTYYFNPSKVTGDGTSTLTMNYADATGCHYSIKHTVNLSADNAVKSSDLVNLEDVYCVVNNDFELKTINDHRIDTLTGKGISSYWKQEGKYIVHDNLKYNPFVAVVGDPKGEYNYSKDALKDTITIHFLDDRNCPYTKETNVTISGNKAKQDGGLVNLYAAYCKYSEQVELASTFTIDRIDGTGIYANEGKWYLNPSHNDFISNTSNQTIPVKYYYRDGDGCVWYKDYSFKMYSRPTANFSIDASTLCFNDATAFSIDDSNFDSSDDNPIVNWEWDFGNGLKLANPVAGVAAEIETPLHEGRTFGLYTNPKHVYKNSGVYPVSLKLTTQMACSHSIERSILVGNYPKVDFAFDGQVLGTPTQFVNSTTIPSYDEVKNYTWNFDDPANPNSEQDNAMSKSFEYKFSQAGVHNVSLTAVSINGCVTDTVVKIPVFPYVKVDNDANYFETFNSSQETGWLPAHSYGKGLPSGWRLSPVDGVYNAYPNTSGVAWLTGNPNYGIVNEQSWVESPCFNIKDLDFPLLSVDVFQSVEKGRDGAVVQYSLDDGKTWNLLSNGASLEGGLNWYNQKGIVSNPGSQTGTGNMGWSENSRQWQTARFPLDQVRQEAKEAKAQCIRFRIAYSSDAGNVQGDELNGFAFDNFVLSGRTRIVMMEQFINSVSDSLTQQNEEAWLNRFVSANPNEVVDLRYHNFISHDYDPLFYINPPDISARSMEYGAQVSQLTMVDGIYRCIASAENEAKAYYNLRTLTDKRFSIDVTTNLESDKLNITANITKLTDTLTTLGSQKCVVRMAIVQKEYAHKGKTYKNVMVELLPNGEGNVVATIPATLAKGETITAHGTWEPNVTTIGNEFKLVVYVQGVWGVDEVHQVWFKDTIDVPQVSIVPPVEMSQPEKYNFRIYPLPVKENLTVEWEAELENDVHWKLVSSIGVTVMQGIAPAGTITQLIDMSDMPAGVYLLVTRNPNSNKLETRKVLVDD